MLRSLMLLQKRYSQFPDNYPRIDNIHLILSEKLNSYWGKLVLKTKIGISKSESEYLTNLFHRYH